MRSQVQNIHLGRCHQTFCNYQITNMKLSETLEEGKSLDIKKHVIIKFCRILVHFSGLNDPLMSHTGIK